MQHDPFFDVWDLAFVKKLLEDVTSPIAVQAYQEGIYGYPYDYSWYLSAVDEGAFLLNKGIYNDNVSDFFNGVELLMFVYTI